MDDFSEPTSHAESVAYSSALSDPLRLLVAGLLAPCMIFLVTRFMSERASEKVDGKNESTVWLLPYWIPVIGHAFSLYVTPAILVQEINQGKASMIHSI